MGGDNQIRSVVRTFSVIEALVEQSSAGVSAIADETGLPKSTVHNHLSTLQDLNVVKRDGNGYAPTLRLLKLAGRHRKHLDIYQSAERPMSELAIKTDGFVDLYYEEDGYSVLLNLDYGEMPVEIGFAYEGMRRPLHISASGLSILAFQPAEYVDEILDRYHGSPMIDEPIDKSDVRDRLDSIRSRSYAIDEELAMVGMAGVGAPITNRKGRAVAGMSVYKPINDMSEEFFKMSLPDMVCTKANLIEVNLNYS